ncbi:glycosyltransferase [Tateyamaria armeniaca]|uniref:Glycosyltransferase n=1 Tax=Tateyamaria armeniaca TaxID=2518930 RepID=A0ABW8UR00_9RHOB
MAVFNGADTLPAQLASFVDQTHKNWSLLASDDGSLDDTRSVLNGFRNTHDHARIEIIDGPKNGAAANFLAMLRHVANQKSAPQWIAFSDQDDVWLPDKVARALTALKKQDPTVPALYCGRTWVTCPSLSTRRLSAPRPRAPDFRNALVQNIAAGNTIVLNPAAVKLVLNAVRKVRTVVVHDWWLYQLITGVGGVVIHDDAPCLLYRQHSRNQIGVNDTMRARLYRMIQLLRGISEHGTEPISLRCAPRRTCWTLTIAPGSKPLPSCHRNPFGAAWHHSGTCGYTARHLVAQRRCGSPWCSVWCDPGHSRRCPANAWYSGLALHPVLLKT